MKKLIALGFLVVMASAMYLGGGLFFFAVEPLSSGQKEPKYVLVRKGDSPTELSQSLSALGVVSDSKKFFQLGKVLRKWSKIKAGEYAVHPGMSPLDLFGVLESGQSVQHPITIREGENIYEISKKFEAKGLIPSQKFLELVQSRSFMKTAGLTEPLPPSLEGYLYPETYNFNRTQTPEEMIKTLTKKMSSSWKPEWNQRAQELGFSRHQLLTLASMIEKETGAPKERPMISSVFHNRLKIKMRLQSDPTIIYGIWDIYLQNGRNIRRVDRDHPTPYNTYTVSALPLGPIGNPSVEAIEAALYPVESDFLFFVSHNDGTHEFTRKYGDHLKAVQDFQLNPKAREGKSWRDLSKKKQ